MRLVRKLKSVLGLEEEASGRRQPRPSEVTIEPSAEPTEPTPSEPSTDSTEETVSTPVTALSGIGPAYGDRLEEAGVTSVTDLLDADIERLATETDISETRIRGWVEQAREKQ